MLLAMRLRFVMATSLVVMVACGGSKSTERRDGAIQNDDVSPGVDVLADTVAPDASDVAVAVDTSAKDSITADLVGDVSVADGTTSADGDGRDVTLDDVASDVSVSDGIVRLDIAVESVRDGAVMSDALAAFCTGNLQRMATNGNPTAPAIRTSITPMDCCDGITVELITATFLTSIYVSWLIPAGEPLPMDVDLSAPSGIYPLQVATNCASKGTNCTDTYTSGFVGRMQGGRLDGSYGYELSLCLHVEESPDSPHDVLHSFDLYLPHLLVQ